MERDFEIKLILEVEAHKCLYDKTSPEYKDRYKKTRSWEEIANILGRTTTECKKKWENLRDSFRSYFKAENNVRSGSGMTKCTKWVHFEALKFLIPFVKVPSTVGNYYEYKTKMENIDVSTEATNNLEFPSTSGMDEVHTKKRLGKSQKADGTILEILSAIENVPPEKETSAIRNFFISLGQQAESLDRRQQLKLQMKCLQALEDVELQQMECLQALEDVELRLTEYDQ